MHMQRFYHEGSNCHDTYVNLVNDRIAAISFSKSEDFSLIAAELRSLTERLGNLFEDLSVTDSNLNSEKLTEFIETTAYQTESINELTQIIDPAMGYIYPEHIKGFVSTIMNERIKNFIGEISIKFSSAESQAEHLRTTPTKPKNKKPNLFFKDRLEILKDKISAKHDIHPHTMQPEFDLILKIIRALSSIENKYPCEELLEEIYNTVGLYRGALIPYDNDSENIESERESNTTILQNLQNLLNASEFTIDKFLKLDLASRWHLITYPNSTLSVKDENGKEQSIDMLVVEDDALQIFIKCKQLLFNKEKNKEYVGESRYIFKNLGITINHDPEYIEYYLSKICKTIAIIMVPLNIRLDLYGSFDNKSIDIAQRDIHAFRYIALTLKLCPIKLLQLPVATLHEILSNYEMIAYRCEQTGITAADLIALPKNEIEMILNTEYYLHRLPVLTRVYFLSTQQFLDASLEQKEAWLKCPSSTKHSFSSTNASFDAVKLKEVLQTINAKTKPALDKLVSTEALLYLKELTMTPWDISTELQKCGFKYNQCRTIFKALSFLNNNFKDAFIERFTSNEVPELLPTNISDHYKKQFEIRFGLENSLIVYQAIEDYVAALINVLALTSSEELPNEFQSILGCNEPDEIIIDIASKLYENNLFCKHLRLYKKINHPELRDKLVISELPYFSVRYSDGDIGIFSMIYDAKDNIDYAAILKNFQDVKYDVRNVQELSVFGYASESGDLRLMDEITTSIKRRSKEAVQSFLAENKFNKPPASKGMFSLFKHQNDLNPRIINVVHQNTGDTPLLAAIRQRNSTVALGLIAWGADLDVKDANGLTPAMLANELDVESIVLDINNKKTHLELLKTERSTRNSTRRFVRL